MAKMDESEEPYFLAVLLDISASYFCKIMSLEEERAGR
jgi:hypothetical protein